MTKCCKGCQHTGFFIHSYMPKPIPHITDRKDSSFGKFYQNAINCAEWIIESFQNPFNGFVSTQMCNLPDGLFITMLLPRLYSPIQILQYPSSADFHILDYIVLLEFYSVISIQFLLWGLCRVTAFLQGNSHLWKHPHMHCLHCPWDFPFLYLHYSYKICMAIFPKKGPWCLSSTTTKLSRYCLIFQVIYYEVTFSPNLYVAVTVFIRLLHKASSLPLWTGI